MGDFSDTIKHQIKSSRTNDQIFRNEPLTILNFQFLDLSVLCQRHFRMAISESMVNGQAN